MLKSKLPKHQLISLVTKIEYLHGWVFPALEPQTICIQTARPDINVIIFVMHFGLATEYASTSKAEEKSDVYSYGVVLLELLTGCTPVGAFGSSDEGIDNVVEWAKVKTNGNKEEVVKILDGRLTNVPAAEAMQVFFVAMLCVQEHGFQRPSMRQVLQMLAQLQINPTHQHMGSIENQASSSIQVMHCV
ncbi:hypothetical protein ACLOJK_008544 [Asimina triloba]